MFSLPLAVSTYQSIPWRQTEYNLHMILNDHILGYFYQEKLPPHDSSNSISFKYILYLSIIRCSLSALHNGRRDCDPCTCSQWIVILNTEIRSRKAGLNNRAHQTFIGRTCNSYFAFCCSHQQVNSRTLLLLLPKDRPGMCPLACIRSAGAAPSQMTLHRSSAKVEPHFCRTTLCTGISTVPMPGGCSDASAN